MADRKTGDPAVRIAEMLCPPAPTTPMKANCDPPVNIKLDRAMVCQKDSPAAIDKAPKEMPYSPVATDTDNACRNTAGRPGSVIWLIGSVYFPGRMSSTVPA